MTEPTRSWISGPHKDRTRISPHQELPRCGPGMGGEGGDQTDRAVMSPKAPSSRSCRTRRRTGPRLSVEGLPHVPATRPTMRAATRPQPQHQHTRIATRLKLAFLGVRHHRTEMRVTGRQADPATFVAEQQPLGLLLVTGPPHLVVIVIRQTEEPLVRDGEPPTRSMTRPVRSRWNDGQGLSQHAASYPNP